MQSKKLNFSSLKRVYGVCVHFKGALTITTLTVLIACALAMLVNRYGLVDAQMSNVIKVISWIPWGGAFVGNSYQTWGGQSLEEKWFDRLYIGLMLLAIFLGVFESQLHV